MMDSQDNVLKQDITEEAVAVQPANVDNDTVAEAGNAPATTAVDSEPDTEAAPLKMYASKYEVLERVKELAHSDETPAKDEVDHLKTAFYKLLFAEREADQKTFIENGGDPEAYVMKTDDSEEQFKAEMGLIKEKRAKAFQQQEEENLTRKTALCEKVEAIAKEENKNATDWENHTKQIIDIQTEWKTIGFAPQKMNVKIFDRFRAACDDFFGRKAEFFKTLKEKFAENTKKKKEMVEQAKALMDSTDWKATSDKLIKLQKEWKTTGMVPKKVGDQLWAEFVAACNKFFEARNAATAGTRNEEQQNLDRKKEIIAKLKELLDSTADNVQATLQQLIDEYGKIGHVPFKEKDKLFKEYHKVVDALYKQLNISASKQRLDNFKSSIKSMAKQGEDMLDNERGRLMRRYEQLKSEITTYENNLGFLNASSKKGNSLIDEMNRKVNKLKDDLELIRQKIKAIDAENK